MRLTIFALALATAGMAGCIQGEPLTDGTAEVGALEPDVVIDPVLEEVALPVGVPTWDVGHAWTVQSHGLGGGGTCVLAVAQADGDYRVLPSCEDVAHYDAVFDVSYVGTIRGDDLSGGQHGTPVRFFDFPLEDGKTWSTTWDGITVTLTATAAPNLAAPGAGSGPGFTITGLDEAGEVYVTYDFAPAIKWWTHIEFSEGYGFKVQGFEENYRGKVIASEGRVLYEHQPPTMGFLDPAPSPFKLEEGADALVVVFSGGAPGYAVAANIVGPNGVAYDRVESAENGGFFEVAFIDPAPGDYVVETVGAHEPSGGFELIVHEVRLEERQVEGSPA